MNIRLTILLLLSSCSGHPQGFHNCIASARQISFHYRANGRNIGSPEALAASDKRIRFAMNAEMYAGGRGSEYTPVGLYVEKGQLLHKIVRVNNPKVNFGMHPQCVFAITKGGSAIMVPLDSVKTTEYEYAVELAPMVVINGGVNPLLTKSESRCVRNGIGLFRDGRVLLTISEGPVSFQEFARYFIQQGCVSAAYVDGVVSEAWQRGAANDAGGSFAVIVAVRD